MGLISFANKPTASQAGVVEFVEGKPVQSVRGLFGTHDGRVAAVLGGGKSLKADIAKLPKNCVMIGVNTHAASFMPVDYSVCLDFDIAEKVRAHSSDCKIISTNYEKAVDYVIADGDKEDMQAHFQSTIPAVMLAVKMGCKKVIVCGVDLYESGVYFDGEKVTSNPPDKKTQLEFWRAAKQALGDDAKKVMASAGSPLAEVFNGK